MPPRAAIAALTLVVILDARAQSQPDSPAPSPLIGEEKRTREELDVAAQAVMDRRWDEALRRYQQILADSGDLFVPVDGQRSLPARWIVHQKLSHLDAVALKLYRAHADATAQPWLQRGGANR